MKKLLGTVVLLLAIALCVIGADSRSCAGGTCVGDFRLLVEPPHGGASLPLNSVNAIRSGDKLRYEPLEIPTQIKEKARIAIILTTNDPSSTKGMAVLEPKPAKSSAQWTIPFNVKVAGLVFGPQGLDIKKVNSLVGRNQELIDQLADYAEQTAQVGALVETLASSEQSSPSRSNLDAALSGFSSRYGVALPKLDASAPSNQQALLLLRAILPSLSTYDPLNAQPSAIMQQSAGLATAVAGLFFGTPVTLAAGGAALFQNLRALMSPDTEFRSAYSQSFGTNGIALCSKPQPTKSRMRMAYFWALRVPGAAAPRLSVTGSPHLPVGAKSAIKLSPADPTQSKLLTWVRDWQLVSATGGDAFPVTVSSGNPSDTLILDLSQVCIPAGEYHLAAKWDWAVLEVPGTLNLHPFGNLAEAKLTPESEDRLVEGAGPVVVQMTGTDFQFVEKVTLSKTAARSSSPAEVPFTLAQGRRSGVQKNMELDIDTKTLTQGEYRLQILQSNGTARDFALLIHAPNPKLEGLPIRLNLGEEQQTVLLRGTGLEHMSGISGDGMIWELHTAEPTTTAQQASMGSFTRKATVKLAPGVTQGERKKLNLAVKDLHFPLSVNDAVEVVGPRPVIERVEKSFSTELAGALQYDEIPAGVAVSFALRVSHLSSPVQVELVSRNNGTAGTTLVLRPGDNNGKARLDLAGEEVLFLTMDPSIAGTTGSLLSVTVSADPVGKSEPYDLGRIVRLPRIDQFQLTEERISDALYVALLTGEDLQTIEKAGWAPQEGFPVQGIPTSAGVGSPKQTLQIALSWPSPSPRAPIYVWLRGENKGRPMRVKYF